MSKGQKIALGVIIFIFFLIAIQARADTTSTSSYGQIDTPEKYFDWKNSDSYKSWKERQ